MPNNRPPDFRVRIPEDLKEKIRASAEKHNRSMGADIIARVEQSFLKDFHSADTAFPLLLAALMEYLPKDGRYTKQEAQELLPKVLEYMTHPNFLKLYFQSISDYDETVGLNPLADNGR